MSTLAGSGSRARARKPFWQTNAFWFVGMPTTLVGFVFLLGIIAEALGR
jgi:hypothetical protein